MEWGVYGEGTHQIGGVSALVRVERGVVNDFLPSCFRFLKGLVRKRLYGTRSFSLTSFQ